MPSSATVSEIIEPAGNDMQILPPTVAALQILNDISKEWQHSRISGAAAQSAGASNRFNSAIVQVAAISRPSPEAGCAGQRRDSRSTSVSVPIWGVENRKVPPASQA